VTDSHAPVLEEVRPAAFAIAYRMLGSVAEAEDVVQEALLRLHRALERGERIESPRAYTATVATRLSIDVLRSARVRRETYVGEWLPEPLVTDPAEDPARHAEMADSLSLAFLVLLERLSPEQRAVFLLHDIFGYGYGEIAEIVGKSEANTSSPRGRAGTSTRRGLASKRPASSVTSLRGASSRRPGTATWTACASCSPRTWSCTATAAARSRPSGARSTAPGAWRRRWAHGRSRPPASRGSASASSR
jgi:RNA polymerase sigma-70 factor (ECF subfamily)